MPDGTTSFDGKSHVAQALGHLAIRHGADVRFAKTSRVLAAGHAMPMAPGAAGYANSPNPLS